MALGVGPMLRTPSLRPRGSTHALRRFPATCRSAATVPHVPDIYIEAENNAEMKAFQDHQKNAARIEPAEECRTWIQLARHGVLAVLSSGEDVYPVTSVVEFADDGHGRPVFATSTMSPHTAGLAGGKVALTVTSPAFSSLADGRVSLQGRVRPVTDAEKPNIRELYLKKFPNAFYVDFGDFRWFVLEELNGVHYNGGFAMAQRVTPDEYLAASPDPVAAFSAPVCKHMNDDHNADNMAIVTRYTGLTGVEAVSLLDLDRLGMNAQVKRKGETFKVRLPFPKPAPDRKGIKEAIVEMTKAIKVASRPASA
eukprot:CAMPEP_0119107158 /NCGR_PEP_ID=MMETSP1180-20130426/8630_1 /TAXON_ID=3052 ORGANISM="Chlamydomonas cf sp, Strain CCMP681" /NCGR_SAMPLE_ID=MMETSP1180 /ASSEMBLY_ACC=CAM_ASM_000741 /LENGTH=309 /DNA_ID=CAMNT_0007092607 /DNA_START=44 /DNA_END=973 /DNA_ORIENTATION=+